MVTETDEEGYFGARVPRLGSWIIAARGRAGLNEAYWTDDLVLVLKPGENVIVKLGSPEKSCLQ